MLSCAKAMQQKLKDAGADKAEVFFKPKATRLFMEKK